MPGQSAAAQLSSVIKEQLWINSGKEHVNGNADFIKIAWNWSFIKLNCAAGAKKWRA